MSSADALRLAARGRWADILAAIGVPHSYLQNKHTECPFCGGLDRFRFSDHNGDGMFICNQCGAGDGFTFVQRFLGIESFKDVARKVEAEIGFARERKAQQDTVDPKAAIEKMRERWRVCKRIRPGDFVSKYLRSRVGAYDFPQCIRVGEKPRAMVAAMMSHEGRVVMLHETYLTEDGKKADVVPVRKFYPGFIPDGAAVRLYPMGDEGVIGIAEGIETAMSAAKLFSMPVWAALNSTMLTKWIVPKGAKVVKVFGDADSNYAGQAAAYVLAKKLMAVKEDARPEVEVIVPQKLGTDWNDILCNQQ